MRTLLPVVLAALPLAAAPAVGPLHVGEQNPRYFAAPDGHPVFLAGFHDGWELQDYAWGDQNAGVLFDWNGFLDDLVGHNGNVFRLWCVEHTKIVDADQDLTTPMPYLRVPGAEKANDGGDRFDLDQFNPAYFERMRQRTAQAGERGVYVIVMLFEGWSIESKGGRVNPWPYHPFHQGNNVNGVDGDLNGDGEGSELHTWLGAEHPITARQRAYVRQVVETVGDLDNVLYEIANESATESLPWQSHLVDYLHEVEAARGKRHPAGITAPYGGRRHPGYNQEMLAGPADWLSPNREAPDGYDYRGNPPPGDGRKVMLVDTDHLFGVGCKDVAWVWKTFCRGHNLLYMDAWTLERGDPGREQIRRDLGRARSYAEQMDLAQAKPLPELASTGYCLAAPGADYVVYLPDGGEATVDLSAGPGPYTVEWHNPRSGANLAGEPVVGAGRRTLAAPFGGDAVLVLHRQG